MRNTEKEIIEKKVATLEKQVQKQLVTIRIITITIMFIAINNLTLVLKIKSVINVLDMTTQLIEKLTTLIL